MAGEPLTERERLKYEERLRVTIEAAGALFTAEKAAEAWGRTKLAQENKRLALEIWAEAVELQQALGSGRKP